MKSLNLIDIDRDSALSFGDLASRFESLWYPMRGQHISDEFIVPGKRYLRVKAEYSIKRDSCACFKHIVPRMLSDPKGIAYSGP